MSDTTPVAIAIVERNGFYALLLRAKNGRWTFPGGKIDAGEKPVEAAVRETFEETGLRVLAYRELGLHMGNDGKPRTYFICRVVAGELRNAESDKFKEAGWKTAAEIIALVGNRLWPPVRAYLDEQMKRVPAPLPVMT